MRKNTKTSSREIKHRKRNQTKTQLGCNLQTSNRSTRI